MSLKKENSSGAITILERFTQQNPAIERNAVRRVFSEVKRAWPGTVDRLWWKWFSESANSLGMRTKTLDCSVDEAYWLARDHVQFVCFRADDRSDQGDWFSVIGASRRKFEVCTSSDVDSFESIKGNALKSILEGYAVDGQVRCVVVLPSESAKASSSPGETLNPINRVLQLLKPESSDIWLVLIFAFVVATLMLATPMAVEALVNTVAFGRFLQPIFILALLLLTFLGFQGAIRALQTYVVEIIQRRLFARVAGDIAYRLPRTEQEAADGKYLPEVVNRFFDVITVQKVAAQLFLDGLGLVLGTFIGMAVLGFYHPWLLGFDLLLLGSIAIIIFVLGRGAIRSAVQESKHKYYMASWLEDIARCNTAFRNHGGSEFALERADRLIHNYLAARKKHFRIVLRQVIFALGLQAVASTVLLGLGGWLVVAGELTLGQLVAAELIVTVIVGSFAKFGKHMESFYDLCA